MQKFKRVFTLLVVLTTTAWFSLSAQAALAVGSVTGTVSMPDGDPYASTLAAVAYVQAEDGMLDPATPYFANVDNSGAFTVSDVPAGTWYVYVLPDTTSDYSFSEDGVDVIVTDNASTSAGMLGVTNTEFRGTVYETVDGSPVAVEDVRVEAGTTDGVVYRGMKTLSDGTYNVGGIQEELTDASYDPGDYPISLNALPDDRPDLMNQNGVFDGVIQPMTITENDITLENAPKSISGTVLRENGDPVEGAIINAVSLSGESARNTSTDSDGMYALNLVGGQWSIDANPDYEDVNPIDWANLEPATTVTFLGDDSAETYELNYTVVDADIVVSGTAFNSDSSIPLTADISVVDKNGNSISRKIDNDDGSFSLNVPAGTYTLMVAPLPGLGDDKFALQQFVAEPTDTTVDVGELTGLDPTATVSGIVYRQVPENDGEDDGDDLDANVQTTTPVSGVNVQAWDLENHIVYSGETDDNGEYSISVHAGQWLITTVGSEADIITTVEADEVSTGHDMTMTQIDGSITGSLVDEDGNALSVPYGIVPFAVSDTGQVYSGEMEENGTDFSVDVASDHTYIVSVSLDPSVAYTVVNPVDDVQLQDEIIVALQADSDAITGTIKDSNGEAITGLNVIVAAAKGDAVKQTTVDTSDGTYTLDVAFGDWLVSYQIVDDTTAYLQKNSSDSVTVEAGVTASHDITIESALETISGTVTDSSGEEVYDAEVVASNHESLEDEYNSGESVSTDELVQVVATTDETGSYEVTVPAGEYDVAASNHVEADIAPEAESVTVSDEAVSDVDFSYQDSTTTLSGTVKRDGQAVVDAVVKVFNEDGFTDVATTDSSGAYSLELVDGSYTVEALALTDGVLYRSGRETVSVSGTTEKELAVVADTTIEVPTAQKLDFDAAVSQYVAVGEAIAIHIPAYAVGTSGTYSIFITPVLDVNETASNNMVNFAFEALIFDSSNVPVYKFYRDLIIHTDYSEETLDEQNIAEDGLVTRYENTATDVLEEPGVQILDTESNSVHFLQNHFTAFALTSTIQGYPTPDRVKGVKVKKRTTTSAVVSWKRAENAKTYTMQLRSKKSNKVIKTYTKIKKLKKTVKKLKSNTKYKVRVRAISNHAVKGKWSKYTTFRTKS